MSSNFCVFLHVRYMNPKVIEIAHDYLAEIQPKKISMGDFGCILFMWHPTKNWEHIVLIQKKI
jgi:hypothetical protein